MIQLKLSQSNYKGHRDYEKVYIHHFKRIRSLRIHYFTIHKFLIRKRELHVPLYKKCYHLKHKYCNQQNPNPLNELKCDFDYKIN